MKTHRDGFFHCTRIIFSEDSPCLDHDVIALIKKTRGTFSNKWHTGARDCSPIRFYEEQLTTSQYECQENVEYRVSARYRHNCHIRCFTVILLVVKVFRLLSSYPRPCRNSRKQVRGEPGRAAGVPARGARCSLAIVHARTVPSRPWFPATLPQEL
jgi:hypothetical protein